MKRCCVDCGRDFEVRPDQSPRETDVCSSCRAGIGLSNFSDIRGRKKMLSIQADAGMPIEDDYSEESHPKHIKDKADEPAVEDPNLVALMNDGDSQEI